MVKKEVATTKKQEVVDTSFDDEMAEFAGFGMENVTARDVSIPRITILQALSPQVKKNKPEYIHGAEPGIICDVALGELLGTSIIFVPVYFRKDYLEWKPDRGGLVAIHQDPAILEACSKDEKNRFFMPNGNEVVETAQWFGYNVDRNYRPCFIPMSKSQLKRSRNWMNLAQSEEITNSKTGEVIKAPLFYRSYKLSVVEESKDDNDWFGWKAERHVRLTELPAINPRTIRDKAVELRRMIVAGEVVADTKGLEQEVADRQIEGAM